jgi:hypothetical protein
MCCVRVSVYYCESGDEAVAAVFRILTFNFLGAQ